MLSSSRIEFETFSSPPDIQSVVQRFFFLSPKPRDSFHGCSHCSSGQGTLRFPISSRRKLTVLRTRTRNGLTGIGEQSCSIRTVTDSHLSSAKGLIAPLKTASISMDRLLYFYPADRFAVSPSRPSPTSSTPNIAFPVQGKLVWPPSRRNENTSPNDPSDATHLVVHWFSNFRPTIVSRNIECKGTVGSLH